MSDIGKGDVVESVCDHYSPVTGELMIRTGTRDIVAAIWREPGVCYSCLSPAPGIILETHIPEEGFTAWCLCGWRKIGGSQEDTVRMFESSFQGSFKVEWQPPVKEPV